MKELIELYESVKEQIKKEEEMKEKCREKEAIREILADIVRGKKYHYSNNKKLLNKLKIHYTKEQGGGVFCCCGYRFKLSKTNITKIQKYIDENK